MSDARNDTVSRRRVLGSAAVLAGAIGLQVGAASTAEAAPEAPASAAPDGERATRFTLHGSGLRTHGATRQVGDHAVVSGAIAATRDGAAEGEFFAHTTVVSRSHLATASRGSLQTHTFVLPAGTLTGSGVLDHAGAGEFTVTGGTGAYHGARGSYSVHQDVDAFRGGDAVYSFSLMLGKGH
jgi:hypothetical protein